MKERDYTILGFDRHAENVIFYREGKWVFIKHTLPKNKLIAYLDVNPVDVNKNFRNEILEEARIGGRLAIIYSIDGINFQKNEHKSYKNKTYYYRVKRLVSVDEYYDYPYDIDDEKLESWLHQEELKEKEKVLQFKI